MINRCRPSRALGRGDDFLAQHLPGNVGRVRRRRVEYVQVGEDHIAGLARELDNLDGYAVHVVRLSDE